MHTTNLSKGKRNPQSLMWSFPSKAQQNTFTWRPTQETRVVKEERWQWEPSNTVWLKEAMVSLVKNEISGTLYLSSTCQIPLLHLKKTYIWRPWNKYHWSTNIGRRSWSFKTGKAIGIDGIYTVKTNKLVQLKIICNLTDYVTFKCTKSAFVLIKKN